MTFLKKTSIIVLAITFALQNVFAAAVGFTANTKLDLLNPPSTIYVLSGSTADSITFSSTYNEAIVRIPAGSTLNLGSSDSRYLSVAASGATAILTFRDSFIDSGGYIKNWIVESTGSVSFSLHVSEANKSYQVFTNDGSIGYYVSDFSGLLTFADSLSGSKSYSFVSSDAPSGGSSSNNDIVEVIRLPDSDSDSEIDYSDRGTIGASGAVTLIPTTGEFTQAVKLYSKEDSALTVEIQKDTNVKSADGKIFSSIIAAPKKIPAEDVTKSISGGGSSNKVHAAITVDSLGQNVFFDKLASISIPINISEIENPEKLKVFYYNKTENKYKLAGDGGELSADQKTFNVKVNHFTLFAVIESDSNEIDLKYSNVGIYNDINQASPKMRAAATKVIFQDVGSSAWFAPFVAELAAKNIVAGYSDGNFKPEASLNRAEIVKIAVTAFDLEIPENSEDPFDDVSQEDWFAPFVAAAKQAGVVSSEEKTFRPGDFVNRAEALKILLSASGLELPKKASYSKFEDVPYNSWFVRFVNFAEENEIVNGFSDGNFRPEALVNRAELSKMVSLLLELKTKIFAVDTSKKLSFWERVSAKNLFGGLLKVFE